MRRQACAVSLPCEIGPRVVVVTEAVSNFERSVNSVARLQPRCRSSSAAYCILDDVVTDLGPVKNGAGRNVGCRVFDQASNTPANGDTAARVGTDTELGNADQLVQKDNDIARRESQRLVTNRDGVTPSWT